MKDVGKPCKREAYARIDGGRLETGRDHGRRERSRRGNPRGERQDLLSSYATAPVVYPPQVGRHPQGVPEPGRVVPSPHAADSVEGMETVQGSPRQPGSARYQLVPGVGVGVQRQGLLAHRGLSSSYPVPAELVLGQTRPAATVSDLGTFQISLTNRRMRARMSGGVRGGSGDPTPLLDLPGRFCCPAVSRLAVSRLAVVVAGNSDARPGRGGSQGSDDHRQG